LARKRKRLPNVGRDGNVPMGKEGSRNFSQVHLWREKAVRWEEGDLLFK